MVVFLDTRYKFCQFPKQKKGKKKPNVNFCLHSLLKSCYVQCILKNYISGEENVVMSNLKQISRFKLFFDFFLIENLHHYNHNIIIF